MTVKLIYSINEKNYIGKNNKLMWHVPEDLNRFKELTEGGVVIMGRKTYESLPNSVKPLPDRTNVVITSKQIDDVITFNNLMEAIEHFKYHDIWIIGGKRIIEEAYPIAREAVVTYIYNDQIGDVKLDDMPDYFELIKETLVNTSTSGYKYNYQVYRNINYIFDHKVTFENLLNLLNYLSDNITKIELSQLKSVFESIKSLVLGIDDVGKTKLNEFSITDSDLRIQTKYLFDQITDYLNHLYDFTHNKKKLSKTEIRELAESMRFTAIEIKNFIDYLGVNKYEIISLDNLTNKSLSKLMKKVDTIIHINLSSGLKFIVQNILQDVVLDDDVEKVLKKYIKKI